MEKTDNSFAGVFSAVHVSEILEQECSILKNCFTLLVTKKKKMSI